MSKAFKELSVYLLIIIVLILTAVNITNILQVKPIKVLGAETQNKENLFWKSFLDKNPNYIPGLIETGQMDKAKQVDPNFEGLR